MLKVKNLKVRFRGQKDWLFEGLNFEVSKGETYFILGENGSGKTALMKALSGDPSVRWDGEISIDGKLLSKIEMRERSRLVLRVGSELLSEFGLTVNEYLSLSSSQDRTSGSTSNFGREVIEQLGNKTLESLSGGQIQRVLLARAETQNTPLWLLDETLSKIDLRGLNKVSLWLKDELKKNRTVLQVSHDPYWVISHGDRALWLDSTQKEGAIYFENRDDLKKHFEEQYRS